MNFRTFPNRAPLTSGRFTPLPAGAVRANGALRERLLALRAGLCDRADTLFPEAGKESSWFGGPLAGGCRASALLEARLLLSAALNDSELRRDSLARVGLVLQHQQASGALGTDSENLQSRGRMLRALGTAYSMTGDRQILLGILRYFKYLRDSLKEQPLSAEDARHVSDTLEAGILFYNITGQKAVLPVLQALAEQGTNYTQLFHAFPYKMPVSRLVSPAELAKGLESEENGTGYYHSLAATADGANLCEGLRAALFSGVITGNGKQLSAMETGLARMNKAHGAVSGGITADPLLAGENPSRGVSIRSMAQLSASLEAGFRFPEDSSAADQWEQLIYNAVSGAFAPDGRSVLPLQRANQASSGAGDESRYSLDDGDSLCDLLGILPRFASHQWMASADGGLAAMGYAACTVDAHPGARVRVKVEGGYPYSGSIRIALSMPEDCVFPMHLRIPAWAVGASAAIGGEILPAEAGTFLTLNRQWQDGDTILLTLPMQAKLIPGWHQSVSVARGPVRYAYAPEAETSRDDKGNIVSVLRGKAAALSRASSLEFITDEQGPALRASVYPMPEWHMHGGLLAQPPIDLPHFTPEEALETLLRPMASLTVRIASMPAAD